MKRETLSVSDSEVSRPGKQAAAGAQASGMEMPEKKLEMRCWICIHWLYILVWETSSKM